MCFWKIKITKIFHNFYQILQILIILYLGFLEICWFWDFVVLMSKFWPFLMILITFDVFVDFDILGRNLIKIF